MTLENHSFEQVIGNANMPYFNALASKYGLATQYYSTMHNSLSALMWLTAGQTVTLDDATVKFFDVPNLVRAMQNSGRSWRSYQSKLPYAGYLGWNTGLYVKRHNPLAYFTDVESSLRYNIVPSVPFLQNDIANGNLPDYSYITPDLNEDAHNGTLAEADYWLKTNVPQLLASPQFQKDGILFIVWDEGHFGDTRYGGGRVATLVIGPKVKPAFRSAVHYNHQSLLRTTCVALALSSCPGGGSTGVPMADFFQASAAAGLSINLTSPSSSTVSSPIYVNARSSGGDSPITSMAVYLDNKLMKQTYTNSITASLSAAKGTYRILVRVWDQNGQTADETQTVNVN